MKVFILGWITVIALACCGAEPVAPFTAFNRPPAVPRTHLDLRITLLTNTIAPVSMQLTNGRADVLAIPVRIENRSTQVISATIGHEWYGGEWPPTDLGAALRRADDTSWRTSEIYLVGEKPERTKPTVWKPGETHDFLLRLNWPGTGSQPTTPLIDDGAPGQYVMKLSILFKSGDQSQFFESQQFEFTVRDKFRE